MIELESGDWGLTYIVDEDLSKLHRAECECMKGKDQVISQYCASAEVWVDSTSDWVDGVEEKATRIE